MMAPIQRGTLVGIFVCLMTVVAGVAVSAQLPARGGQRSAGRDAAASPEAKLRLTTSIVKQEEDEDSNVKLTLGLRFTNVGERPIILYRYSSVISRYTVSRTEEEALGGKCIMNVKLLVMPIVPGPRTGAVPDDRLFVTLQPGESHTTEYNLLLDFEGESDDRTVDRGTYFLRVRVWTWYDSADEAVAQREKWKQFGYLWSESITSEPMRFSIPQ